jgi:hypothetical protein
MHEVIDCDLLAAMKAAGAMAGHLRLAAICATDEARHLAEADRIKAEWKANGYDLEQILKEGK